MEEWNRQSLSIICGILRREEAEGSSRVSEPIASENNCISWGPGRKQSTHLNETSEESNEGAFYKDEGRGKGNPQG